MNAQLPPCAICVTLASQAHQTTNYRCLCRCHWANNAAFFCNVWQFKERTAKQSRAPASQCCQISSSLPGQGGQVTMMMPEQMCRSSLWGPQPLSPTGKAVLVDTPGIQCIAYAPDGWPRQGRAPFPSSPVSSMCCLAPRVAAASRSCCQYSDQVAAMVEGLSRANGD